MSPTKNYQTSIILVMSAVAKEIKSHRKYFVKPKGQPKNDKVIFRKDEEIFQNFRFHVRADKASVYLAVNCK